MQDGSGHCGARVQGQGQVIILPWCHLLGEREEQPFLPPCRGTGCMAEKQPNANTNYPNSDSV